MREVILLPSVQRMISKIFPPHDPQQEKNNFTPVLRAEFAVLAGREFLNGLGCEENRALHAKNG
jgi:hypothetical protein